MEAPVADGAGSADIGPFGVRELARTAAVTPVLGAELARHGMFRDLYGVALEGGDSGRTSTVCGTSSSRRGDRTVARRAGVPRSTLRGWLRGPATDVVTHATVGLSDSALQAKVFDLEHRIEVLAAAMRLLLRAHLPNTEGKYQLLI